MNFGKQFFNEATPAEIRKAGEAELKKTQDENKKGKSDKKDSTWYRKQLESNLAYKRERLEWQKSRSKQKDKLRRDKEAEGRGKSIADPIRSLKTQTISDKDTDPTAYKKAIETGYDTTVAVAKSAINALRKKRQENKEKEQNKQDKLDKERRKSAKQQGEAKAEEKGKKIKSEMGKKLLPPGEPLTAAKKRKMLPAASSPTPGKVTLGSPSPKSKPQLPGKMKKELISKGKYLGRGEFTEQISYWREEFICELGEMRRNRKKKIMDGDYIVDVMKGKNQITVNPSIKEEVVSERKRDTVANALLSLAFAANVVQSPESLVRSGHIEGPGMQLMDRMMKRRKEANKNLDSGRVSHPARNVKKKSVKEELKKEDLLKAIVKKLIDEKKRKNYLLNYGYIGESSDKEKMKCNKPKAQAVGDSLTGKSHVVKACEGGEEKLIRFGQRGVKGSPKKDGESEEYASRRNRFKTRHAKNISKGKMSAAYWANKVKW